jgi:predicted oxidoreductase (fatty acid repression mutant protein)
MNQILKEAIEKRRSFYKISKEPVITDDEIAGIVQHAVQYAPTAFNSQSARVLLLLNKEHDKLWTLTKEILKGVIPPAQFAPTEEKIQSFQDGCGTVLFFEEQATVTDLQQKFPIYRENFPLWSLQSSGMLQYIVWMLLEDAGFGVSLQHYSPLIDEKVKSAWNIPESWMLLGEMPFGKPMAAPEVKSFLPLADRIKVYK